MTASSAPSQEQQAINQAVGDLDRWFDTMRGPRGYTGPVADWWRQGFSWTGTTLDWRYEGVIGAYVALWHRTGNGHWLAKAQWAGDDLLAGQAPSGHFGFGPAKSDSYVAPAPHGAACAGALLEIGAALREAGGEGWLPYAAAGELTLRGAIIGELWDPARQLFRQAQGEHSFLPHQNASICEALFRHADLRHSAEPVEGYALPALRTILSLQIRAAGHPLDGAIPYRIHSQGQAHNVLPVCVARCVPALLKGYDYTHDRAFLEAAWRAFAFLQRWRNPDGSFPAVVYTSSRRNQYPQWIAACGDMLRAAQALEARGISTDTTATLRWILDGQDCSGGIRTARGLGVEAQQRPPATPDVRDLRRVPGWCDKAFRALAELATEVRPRSGPASSEQRCRFRGRVVQLCEDESSVEIRRGTETRYRWRKCDDWPTVCAPEFMIA